MDVKRLSCASTGVEGWLRGRSDPMNRGRRRRSVQGSGVEARGSRAGLDEVMKDSQDLWGIGDDSEDLHRGTTAGATQGVHLIHLCQHSRAQAARDSLADTD